MASKNIVLIGFMGSGKTVVSKALSKQLGWKRVSVDEIIEEQEGCRITEIFKRKGEAYFRLQEARAVKDLAQQTNVIIDCGGGIVLNPENVVVLKQTGTVFFLHATPDVIYDRLKNDKTRPLLQVPQPQEAITELFNQRLPLYRRAADIEINSNDPHLSVPVDEILKKL